MKDHLSLIEYPWLFRDSHQALWPSLCAVGNYNFHVTPRFLRGKRHAYCTLKLRLGETESLLLVRVRSAVYEQRSLEMGGTRAPARGKLSSPLVSRPRSSLEQLKLKLGIPSGKSKWDEITFVFEGLKCRLSLFDKRFSPLALSTKLTFGNSDQEILSTRDSE